MRAPNDTRCRVTVGGQPPFRAESESLATRSSVVAVRALAFNLDSATVASHRWLSLARLERALCVTRRDRFWSRGAAR